MAIVNNRKSAEELVKMLQDTVNIPTTISPASSLWSFNSLKTIPVETDEQGNIIGYKVLIFDLREGRFISPLYPARWNTNGWLESDLVPEESTRHGIYTLKSFNHPELEDYYIREKYKNREFLTRNHYYRFPFKVRCIISGVIVEGEYGFRSQYAKIEGVEKNGYWKTYQDFYYEAGYSARERSHQEARYTDNYRTFVAGAWDTLPRMADEDAEEGGS